MLEELDVEEVMNKFVSIGIWQDEADPWGPMRSARTITNNY
jgi:hypothetical protein